MQALASELKTGFTEAMQELSRIQHGEYALEEKVKSCRCSMEEKVTEMKNSLNYFKVGPSSISLLEISGHLNRSKKTKQNKKKKTKKLAFLPSNQIQEFSSGPFTHFHGKISCFTWLDLYVKIRSYNRSKVFISHSFI